MGRAGNNGNMPLETSLFLALCNTIPNTKRTPVLNSYLFLAQRVTGLTAVLTHVPSLVCLLAQKELRFKV
jgi:hypothetical protein